MKLILTYILLCLIFQIDCFSQTDITKKSLENISFKEYHGEIADARNKEGLAFANISLLNSNISTISNINGDFSIKIPENYKPIIKVSFIGYSPKIVDLKNLKNKRNIILLDVYSIPLSEMILTIPKDVEGLVRKALFNSKSNYLNENLLMTSFFRESIKRRRRNVSLTEAVSKIYKVPYESYKRDVIEFVKLRKNTDYSRLDTLIVKLAGGPFNTLFLDIVKYPNFFIPKENIPLYSYVIKRTTKVNNSPVYVVGFKQKENIELPSIQGELYIKVDKLVIISANFNLNINNKDFIKNLFVVTKPKGANVWPLQAKYKVDYVEKNGKWIFNYSNLLLKLKINYDKKLFNTSYTFASEIAITDWTQNNSLALPKNKMRVKPKIILSDSKLGFIDLDFWGTDNIIEPEKSIQNAIRKIKKQLNRL
ncbi:MAG: carboxypeptidase-like regulatory domain-containing protein [Flavobacteriaceae bacterium]|nr:carboxypeptidase-like regulatory domain-containing protein [Flavobacteriaceae bacterium]MBT3794177.1 carboxypeptidase-like regulatory domain-containing protein [Flavobacteriaceae bacterium]MBT4063106.1 carboxypeptidase-like regulatory domain-containing protein [Flavobacteriaceae bacterium]MBT4415769.1 carboxypeptidase-like regulatory domain-containing protein [Flavobacteriaceae bacterium]MBT5395904.1 carboxypeptidase-like regulatory domain-containing protein [Flavobacteriaceae bacterium]